MYTVQEIEEKRKLAAAAGLSGAELLDNTEMVQEVCNGIGAAWMPERVRLFISRLFPALVMAADIHDIRYEVGKGIAARKRADEEMLENGRKLADYSYAGNDPRRYIVRFVMVEFYRILRICGWLAYYPSKFKKR